MKFGRWFLSLVPVVLLVMAVIVWGLSGLSATANPAFAPSLQGQATETPTEVPSMTPGPSPTWGPPPTFPSLTNAVDTLEEAIAKAYEYDQIMGAMWQTPWDTTTPVTDPDRFIILWFPDINEAEQTVGSNLSFDEYSASDAGAVWSVTILGNVQELGDSQVLYGITYVISERSGQFWIRRVGLEVVPPTPTPTPVDSFFEPDPTEIPTSTPTRAPYP